ncbi:hypothetical protein BT93_J1089 [Corymbia citriodora subsp. variegata]|nr:hypothetical protein BT93_J1089 [Corymbia citriodora subsp. variegata]KAF8010353.1 hypothetical protein BT93_J1089 [Corymbia citriodora subsp. variegata]KAF8010354.1 hypothetical protein BT93_J1089 [Corymbia citriodora subsp. variegata]
MECLELSKSSGVEKAPKTENGKTYAYRSMNLQERFQVDANLSYVDFHHEITNAVGDEPTYPLEDKQNARIRRCTTKDDELVKYMSKLPAFLERGKNVQETAFSVGVLDWRRLEKWQHSHKLSLPRNGRYSTSSSSTSSSFSVEGSSSHSSRGRSCSPVHQRIPHSMLQSQLLSSPKNMDVQSVRPSRENLSKYKDLKDVHENDYRQVQHEVNGTVQIHLREKMEHKKGRFDPEPNQKAETLPCFRSAELGSCSTEKAEVKECDFVKRSEKTQESNSGVFEPELTERPNRVVLLMPKDVPNRANPEGSKLVKSRTHSNKKLSEASGRGSLERSRETHHARLHSDVQHSCTCPLPLEYECNNQLRMKRPSSMDARSSKFPSDVSCQPERSAGVPYTPRLGNSDKKIPSIKPMVSDAARGSEPKVGNVTTEKARSTSPFRRLSIGMGKIVKNSGSKEGLTPGKLDAKHASAKLIPENAESSTCPDNPRADKSNSAGRSRSSPLRRLLDPILKPKSSIIHHCSDPLQEHSVSKDKLCTSLNSQSDPLTGQPAKMKLDLSSCKSIDVRNSHLNKKQGSSSVQALLRVAYKNGLPLFSFAVDNDSDILAATMKECSSLQADKSSWMYTFFTIREARKKSGSWISQGNRGKGQGYTPNVVAQMKVSGLCFLNLKSGVSTHQYGSLEYVLLAVDTRQQDQQTTEFQPKDELAAIVAQVPWPMEKGSAQDGPENNTRNSLSELESIGSFKNRLSNSANGENPGDRSPLVNEVPISATVILPSGVHSLPSNGGPSSLIERWKSGGSCDCGGWDMGCELKILGTHGHPCKNSSSSNSSDQFALFSQSQVDTQENQPAFILAPFKDNIFSVEFSSSLTVLQAFSTCIAVLDSRKLIKRLESHSAAGEKPLGKTMSTYEGSTRPPNHITQDGSAKYVTYPPLSPVGRA